MPCSGLLGYNFIKFNNRFVKVATEFWVISAAMLNAEAATHPVPADPRELAASLRAGDLCWRRFPYLVERYGERGYRFTRSDSAWLATLTQLDPPTATEQIFWLRQVLSTRGIPSIILQTHLNILCDELDAAFPADRAVHDKLRQAAVGLRDARAAHIPQVQIAALSTAFDLATEAFWRARLPQTPQLLVAAVADEADGSLGAAANISGWMTNPRRFPAGWIAAVEATVSQARTAAGAHAHRVQP